MKRVGLAAIASMSLVLVLADGSASAAAPIDGARYDQTDPSAPIVFFTVKGGAVQDWSWGVPDSCVNQETGEVREGDFPYPNPSAFPQTADSPPAPIDAAGHFEIRLDDVANPNAETHVLIEGTIDGAQARGTASVTQNFPLSHQTCSSGTVGWTASTAVSDASPCKKAKAKVSALRRRLAAARGAKQRRRLRKKLAKAKRRKAAVCRRTAPSRELP